MTLGSDFCYKDNQLCLGDFLISKLNIKTPFFLYDLGYIKSRYGLLKNGLKNQNNLICYALKANFNKQIVQNLIAIGSGIDCVSIEEIKYVLSLKCKPEKIVFSGVAKTKDDLIFAVAAQIKQINLESVEEFDELCEIVEKIHVKANICLRVNLDVKADTHKYIATGSGNDKFGIELGQVDYIIGKIKQNDLLNFIGFSIHIGSQILDYKSFETAFNAFADVVKKYPEVKSVSLGGGLGVAYKPEEEKLATDIIEKYLELVNNFHNDIGSEIELILEPGRFLVANSCVVVAEVVRIKKTKNQQFLILNVGMNNIIRPALYQAYHHILPLIKNKEPLEQNYKIVGPICESSDVFHENYSMQKMQAGDKVLIFSTGAYCRSMASNYNLVKIAEEILL